MKLTKKVIAAVLIAGFLATFIALPQAEAGDPIGITAGLATITITATTTRAQPRSLAGSRSAR